MIGSLIHRAMRGEKLSRPPYWFMRQAGRYLPEYREVRAKAGDFLDLCYHPEMASEVTLQPIRRFDMDAAIIFSDILVIPHAMGINVRFEQGEGPRLSPTLTLQAASALDTAVEGKLSPVAEALRLTRKQLHTSKSLIGFCGLPWTVACYMVEGKTSRDYENVRRFALENEEIFIRIVEKIIEASVSYLSMQVEAGADVIQLFDSWAGVLSPDEYEKWVLTPSRKLVSAFKAIHADVPVIGFPRGSGTKYPYYAGMVPVDAVAVDVQTPVEWARDHMQKPLQGNLDPVLLACDKKGAVRKTREIITSMRGKPFIFNLGHGILPFTPVENVQAVCEAIREGSE